VFVNVQSIRLLDESIQEHTSLWKKQSIPKQDTKSAILKENNAMDN
jgi:hypothetical protein